MNLAATTSAPPSSFASFASGLINREGVTSLYTGLAAGLWRQVFYTTARVGLFDVFKDAAAKYRETDFIQRFTLASAAGGCAAAISCPVEVCLVRISNDAALPAAERRNYGSVPSAVLRIVKEEGAPALFRGANSLVVRALLVGGTQVGTYDQFKAVAHERLGLKPGSVANTLVASFGAGLVCSIATLPFETAKNRMAFQRADATGRLPYSSMTQTITTVAEREGLAALWTGFVPYWLRTGGMAVALFMSVETLRKNYRKYCL